MKIYLITLLGMFFFTSFQPDVLQIEIVRETKTNNCILGRMNANGVAICKTLELPWKENEEDISSVPAGDYKGTLRYDHTDQWRIELENVKDRTHVQIHIGNYTTDTKGCILVGTTANKNCSVTDSKTAYWKLKKAFYGTEFPNSTPNKEIEISIHD